MCGWAEHKLLGNRGIKHEDVVRWQLCLEERRLLGSRDKFSKLGNWRSIDGHREIPYAIAVTITLRRRSDELGRARVWRIIEECEIGIVNHREKDSLAARYLALPHCRIVEIAKAQRTREKPNWPLLTNPAPVPRCVKNRVVRQPGLVPPTATIRHPGRHKSSQ